MRARAGVGVLGLLLMPALAGCPGELPEVGGTGRLPLGPTAAPDSPLFIHFPELDQRILRVDLGTGRALQTYYPDLWDARIDHVIDFAVDRGTIYLLPGAREPWVRPTLLLADLKTGTLRSSLDLPPMPLSLGWTCDGRLIVGHGTPAQGPYGRLTLVDPRGPKVLETIALEGAVHSVAPSGDRAVVLERAVRGAAEKDVVVLSNLAEVDLARGSVLRRRSLPPGGREVVVGPSGLIYVSHASGLGVMATDGTVSVIDPRTLRVIERVRLEMVVRRMRATPRFLVLNMLASTGDPWVEVQNEDNVTQSDFRLEELISGELTVVGGQVVVPYRRGQALFRADLAGGSRLPKLQIGTGGPAHDDRPGMIRTWMGCDAR